MRLNLRKFSKSKAFTLTELLVVVVIIGVLAAVALPKFNRVIETRRTGEAEEMLSAIRMEQEKRCTLDKPYAGTFEQVGDIVASAQVSENRAVTDNYIYNLNATGVSAGSIKKSYSLSIPSYADGRICCEGDYCLTLNKNYPLCSESSFEPSPAACAALNICSDCSCPDYAASNPCVCDSSYVAANACLCTPTSCSCASYATANPAICGCPAGQEIWNGSCKPVCNGGQSHNPDTGICDCSQGLTWNGTSCSKECDSAQVLGCTSKSGTWNSATCSCTCSGGGSWSGSSCECPAETPHFYNGNCNVCPSGQYQNNGVCCHTGQISKDGKTCVYAYQPERVDVGILVDCHQRPSFINKSTCEMTTGLRYFVGGNLPNASGGGCSAHHAVYNRDLWWEGGEVQGYALSKCDTSISDQTFCDNRCEGASCEAKCIVSESYPKTCGVYTCSNGRVCDNASGSGTMLRCVRI